MTLVPSEHSDLVGGSIASRRINCEASYVLEQKIPKQPGSPYARQGTAFHELLARILEQDVDPSDLLPFVHNQPAKGPDEAWTLTITQDDWDELGAPALAMFDDLIARLEDEEGAPFEFVVEKSNPYPNIPGAKGTSDVIFRCGRVGGIVDWKMGRGPVAAENNAQGMFYLKSALAAYPTMMEGVLSYMIVIIQPQVDDNAADEWRLTKEDLADFDLDLREAISGHQTRAKLGEVGEATAGKWCNFARCAVVCPLKIGATASLAELVARRKAVPSGDTFDLRAFYAEALELAHHAEGWAKEVAAQAQNFIDIGGTIEGWATEPKRSSGRDWVITDEKARKVLQQRGLKVDDYAPRKTLTPPAAEKVLKTKGLPEMDAKWYAAKPSSGTTLKRTKPDTTPVETVAEKLAAFAKRYAAK